MVTGHIFTAFLVLYRGTKPAFYFENKINQLSLLGYLLEESFEKNFNSSLVRSETVFFFQQKLFSYQFTEHFYTFTVIKI